MDMLKTLVAYNFAEHRELWATIAALNESRFLKDTGYSAGTIQRTVVHNIRADRLWLNHAMEHANVALLPYEAVDRGVIRAAWDDLEQDTKAFVDSLTGQDAQRHVTYSYQNSVQSQPIYALVLHICNHGTVHRAEICAMLHMLDHTINFDLSFRRYIESVENS